MDHHHNYDSDCHHESNDHHHYHENTDLARQFHTAARMMVGDNLKLQWHEHQSKEKTTNRTQWLWTKILIRTSIIVWDYSKLRTSLTRVTGPGDGLLD
ncbi:hypothetical protein PM082_014299 [Marasmius tenuissimus]|nr:hypothetical protein PM082_014299 [Marasmius tenuissimus]